MYGIEDNATHRAGDATAAFDIEAIGRLVRARTLEAVALHFELMAGGAADPHMVRDLAGDTLGNLTEHRAADVALTTRRIER